MPDTVPGGITTTVVLPLNGTIDGVIDTLGDRDWYSVQLTAGQTYTFRTGALGASDIDTYLRLHNSAGTLVVEDDDAGPATFSLITFTATTTGTYYLDAGAYGDTGTGNFRVGFSTVVAPGVDSVGATAATAGNLGYLTGTIGGAIDAAGDHDWYAIQLVAGQTYLFNANAVNGSPVDTIITLRDASGVQLALNDDAQDSENPTDSGIRFTATTNGTYYLDVSSFGTTTGSFNVFAGIVATPTVYTIDQIANQLTDGYWRGSPHHFNVAPGGTLTFNVQGLTAAGQVLAREALLLWTDVTGITFSEVTTGGQINFINTGEGANASSVYAGGITTSSTVNVSTAWLTSYGTGLNSYSFQTFIHEIGHALGLGHAGNYNGNANYGTDSLYFNDSWATTVMSYFGESENSYFTAMGFTQQFTVSPMVADGVGTTNMYGVNTLTRTGDTVYGFNNTSGRAIYDATANPNVSYTIYDNGGTDTLDYSGFSQAQRINLNAELFSNVGGRVGNVAIARGAVIENAIGGSGADTLIGNNVANVLNGGGADDILQGGLGADQLIGGSGIDTASYEDNNGAIFVNLTAGLGYGGAAQGDTYSGIENIRGTTFADFIIGDNNVNRLEGMGGDDTMIGSMGGDIFDGGTGIDTVSYVDNQGPIFINLISGLGYNNAAQGDSFISIENVVGGIYNDFIIGSSANNRLEGGDGNDYLIGALGADALIGGNGNDTASYEDNQGPIFINLSTGLGYGNAAEGDTFSGIENIVGSLYNDFIIGDAAANRLFGRLGNDTLIGAGGADTFVFDTALGAANVDTITDFVHGTDHIELSHSVFAALGLGALADAAFANGAATTSAQHILYDAATGNLSYDADGSGAGAAIVFANLQNHPATITSADFLIVA